MIFATGWLSLHLFGVFITFALLVIVSQKEDTTYKSELLLTIACCLVTLVAKSIYIVGGSRETLLTIGKLEYLGKCFANYCALMFILRWRNIKIPKWFVNSLLVVNCAFYILIATVDLHHWYYKNYWLAPSKVNLHGYTLEISAAPMYYVFMVFLVAEIFGSIGVILSSYYSKKNMPYKLKLHVILLLAMLSPVILLSLRLFGILKGDDPTPLGMLLSCVFMCIAVVKYKMIDPVKSAKNLVIQNLNEAVVVTDLEGRFLFLNPMAETLVASIRKPLLYRRDIEIYDTLRGSDGYFDWLDHHYQVEETELKSDDIPQGYMLTLVDVTKIMEQNHRMQELVNQAEAATQAKSAFVSNISHEIRTPMNSIVGITEVMLRSEHSPKEQEFLLNIQSSGQALLTIINDVLDFSKIESGKMQLVLEPYDTLSLFHDLKLTMENQIGRRPLELIYEIDPAMPCILNGDVGRIRQVITNLVSNAIKYTESGHVHFSVQVRKKDADKISLYYEVEDTGIGIRKEDQEILFHSFQRVDLKKNRRIQGTGLGLTISQNFVNMMGGTIGVESEYGKGSKFYFTIDQTIMDPTPISEINYEQRHNSVISKEAESVFTAEDAHLLLVDDNSLNLLVAQELLKPLHLQIDTAENGKDAVTMVQQNHYDLVLMDHMMPVMDGIEATKAIRALPEPQYKELPIIALTANAMVDAQKEFANAGMNGFVAKPIDFQIICTQLRKWLPKDMIHELSREEAEKVLSDETETTDSITDSSTDSSAENPTGFRFENGLPYCGSEEALKQIIQIFYNTIDSKSKKIEQCLEEQLLKDYTIEVHALKSSALLIGAPGLSEAAKELEKYGNEENLAALEEKTGPMLTMYRSLKQILRPYVEETESGKKEVSADDWIATLEQMHLCVEQFDMDGVDHAMETLETFQTPDNLKDSMEQLRVCVADVAMEEIMKLTDTMIDLLK